MWELYNFHSECSNTLSLTRPHLCSQICKMNPLTISSKAETMPTFFRNAAAQLMSAVAHEVRNPLANINLAIEMLTPKIKDIDSKIYLDIIKRSSKRINELIKELLNRQLNKEVCTEQHSLHQLLDEALHIAADRIKLKKIKVSKNYTTLDCERILDGPKVKIALTNIIVNATEAMTIEKGELHLVSKFINGKYEIHITDNGCGISKENLNSIFSPTFTTKPGGLGIGLATTYDTLRSNHIGVTVKSEAGKGTCFILTFDS